MTDNNSPKVLIIDDEKGLRIGSQRILEDEGFVVETAENGTEGVRKGTEVDYDLAVIDLKMPDLDGLEVLSEIKKVHPNTVCFIATAYASYETAIESTRLGAYTYIPKPFTPDELIHNLQKGYDQRKLLLESERLRKEQEANLLELAAERSRLSTIINLIADGVLVINKAGELVYCNNAAFKFLDVEDLQIGKSVLNKLPESISINVKKFFESDQFVDSSYSAQIEIKPNELYVEAITSPVPQDNGNLAGVVVVIRNITELKKIEKIKNQFVSMVAHELKTPIAAVQGFINILSDEKVELDKEKQNDFLKRSDVRLRGLLSLVNDLLDISRMETKTKQRELEDLSIKKVIKSTIQFLEFEAKKRNIKIQTSYDKQLPNLKADNGELTRLFTNIIGNAIKYNKDNGEIRISVQNSEHYIIVKISDTGIGLKPEEKERLFQEFYRAKNEHTRGVSGTGLGLTIVKQIIDAYHGKIEVESEYGKGTTFEIYLPINKSKQQ